MQEIKPSNSISDMFSGTIPVKLLLQLATTFQPGGLRNRQGKVIYKDRLRSCKVPVLAIAGDQDLICPPLSVTGETPRVFFRFLWDSFKRVLLLEVEVKIYIEVH